MTVPDTPQQRHRRTEQSPPEDPNVKLSPAQARPPTGPGLRRHPRPHTQAKHKTTGPKARRAFSELIDAKAASLLLGVPHTWLLAQARARKIPHHRLGHYVRFDPNELQAWLRETKIETDPRHRR